MLIHHYRTRFAYCYKRSLYGISWIWASFVAWQLVIRWDFMNAQDWFVGLFKSGLLICITFEFSVLFRYIYKTKCFDYRGRLNQNWWGFKIDYWWKMHDFSPKIMKLLYGHEISTFLLKKEKQFCFDHILIGNVWKTK